MKYYIMIEVGIVGMGGGQMYIRNKAKYLKSLGWQVIVFSGIKGKIRIPDLEEYKKFIITELISSPFVYSRKTVIKVLNNMATYAPNCSEIIIESGSSCCAYWGELLAEKLQAKHIAFILDEKPDVPKQYLPFYKFKMDRRELAGITDKTINLIFNDDDLLLEYESKLSAVCSNVVEDYDSEVLKKIPDEGINIGILGRLDKPYVSIASEAILKMAKKHPNENFNIIYIGDSDIGNKEKCFKKEFRSSHNVKLTFLGYLYPIPKKLFSKIDYCLASSGSAWVAYSENVITISIDGYDGKAIGVLGYTTQNRLYRTNEPQIEVCDLLEEVIFGGFLNNKNFVPGITKLDISFLSVHMDFINNSATNNAYFSMNSIVASGKDKKKRFLCKFLGVRLYLNLRPIYSKLFK